MCWIVLPPLTKDNTQSLDGLLWEESPKSHLCSNIVFALDRRWQQWTNTNICEITLHRHWLNMYIYMHICTGRTDHDRLTNASTFDTTVEVYQFNGTNHRSTELFNDSTHTVCETHLNYSDMHAISKTVP